MKQNGKQVVFHLVGPQGETYGCAGQRWILENNIEKGKCYDTDENDELVEVILPENCTILEEIQ